jgi:hypothetical protein
MLPEPRYPNAKSRTSFQDGLEFQDFVCEQLARRGVVLQNLSSKRYQLEIGENLQGFEIKLDERCTDTQRLSIEVFEKTRDDPTLGWTPSGILRGDNSWLYIQGNRKVLFVFAKRWLLNYYNSQQPEVTEKRGTIKTFYLPFAIARRHAARVIEFESALDTAQ